MNYSKYLKPGQKLLMRALVRQSGPERLDALSVFLQGREEDYLDLVLPYEVRESQDYPFAPGMAFEFLSEAMGLGVRLTGEFHSARGPNRIRIRHHRDLVLIRRRNAPRSEVTVGLRYTKGRGMLRNFRAQWEKNVQLVKDGQWPHNLPAFPPTRANLSCGGIRFDLRAPVRVADLCLLLIDLGDGRPPIPALSEVVWHSDLVIDDCCQAGLQFLNILEEDRQRLATFLSEHRHLAVPAPPQAC